MYWRDFVKALKVHKTDIFHKSDVPSTFIGPIHALAVQLLAKGIIKLIVSDGTKVGTKYLNDKHILVSLTADFLSCWTKFGVPIWVIADFPFV